MRLITAAQLTCLAALIALGSGCSQEPAAPPPILSTAPLIDPNTAPEAVLNGVPGLGGEQVAAIIEGRPFATPTALNAVLGQTLSADELRAIYSAMFIKVGLNTGAEEDYKLIPSTLSPGKLAHEFEEYRPFESIAQFREEMSKYVSEEEVAHLSRYVTLD
jgi:hypothetical protein